MSLTELLPALQALPRADKLQAIQFLASELVREEEVTPLQPGASYPIWSPYDAFEAAETLQRLLQEERPAP